MGIGKVLAGIFCLAGLIGFTGGVSQAAEADTTGYTLYVDQISGSDENNGKSLEQAFQTLEKARDTVRDLEQTGNITIYLNGTYRPLPLRLRRKIPVETVTRSYTGALRMEPLCQVRYP